MAVDSSQSSLGSEQELAQLLDEYLPQKELHRGQIVRGTVVRVSDDAIVVDVGAKCEGIVSGQEMARLGSDVKSSLKPGVTVTVCIVNPDDPCGEIVLSLRRAQQRVDWQRAQELCDSRQEIETEVVAANRGGLIVQLGQLRGFIPASQIAPARNIPRISDANCQATLEQLVGQKLRVLVIEADLEQNRLIMSEKAAQPRPSDKARAECLASVCAGQVREGKVSNLTDFGAFVDVGGVDGLVHLSEISWKRVRHPRDVLHVGQEVKVMVLSVDRERERIALSLKRLEPDPWVTVAERYEVGQLLECRITRLTKWGAFARLVDDEAIEGLIHISELSKRRIEHPREVVQPGEVMTVRVLRVEPERHRLALSLRRAAEEATP